MNSENHVPATFQPESNHVPSMEVPEPTHCGRDGNQFFCMEHDNVPEAIQGWGDTSAEAHEEFRKAYILAHANSGKAFDETSPTATEMLPIVEDVRVDVLHGIRRKGNP